MYPVAEEDVDEQNGASIQRSKTDTLINGSYATTNNTNANPNDNTNNNCKVSPHLLQSDSQPMYSNSYLAAGNAPERDENNPNPNPNSNARVNPALLQRTSSPLEYIKNTTKKLLSPGKQNTDEQVIYEDEEEFHDEYMEYRSSSRHMPANKKSKKKRGHQSSQSNSSLLSSIGQSITQKLTKKSPKHPLPENPSNNNGMKNRYNNNNNSATNSPSKKHKKHLNHNQNIILPKTQMQTGTVSESLHTINTNQANGQTNSNTNTNPNTYTSSSTSTTPTAHHVILPNNNNNNNNGSNVLMGGLKNKFKQMQSSMGGGGRNTIILPVQHTKKEPPSPNSRHQIVPVQSQPFHAQQQPLQQQQEPLPLPHTYPTHAEINEHISSDPNQHNTHNTAHNGKKKSKSKKKKKAHSNREAEVDDRLLVHEPQSTPDILPSASSHSRTQKKAKPNQSHSKSLKKNKSASHSSHSHHKKQTKKSTQKHLPRKPNNYMKGKRHSMQPLPSQEVQRALKKREPKKPLPSGSGHRGSTIVSKSKRRKKKNNVGSDMSMLRTAGNRQLKQRNSTSNVNSLQQVQEEYAQGKLSAEHDDNNNNNGRNHNNTADDNGGSYSSSSSQLNAPGPGSNNSERKASRRKKNSKSKPKSELTEAEAHEAYVKKRDKMCKFRIKNEIFEIYDYYKPVRLCGSGAYAVVCEAIDTRTKKKVAIKKNKHIFDDIRDARRILREIKLLQHYQACRHPDVIELYDTLPPPFEKIDEFDDVYCVMPFMETNLCKIITSKQPLTNLHYQYLTYQVLRGLKYIHSSGVIHRDIKPENILLNGGDCDVKVIDFGLARGVNAEEDEQNKEAQTEYVCTRWYRSPEVMMSGGYYDEKMDIWGVGCIMAEMILRNPLFPGQNYLDQLTKIFDTMGTPKKFAWILNDQARNWVQKLEPHNGKNLKKLMRATFDGTETDLDNCVDLLRKLLILNPAERISAAESLLHPYFKDIHDEEECFTAKQFDLSFEFENSIKTKFGVRHMMYEALSDFHNKKWAKIKKRKKKKHKNKEKHNNINVEENVNHK